MSTWWLFYIFIYINDNSLPWWGYIIRVGDTQLAHSSHCLSPNAQHPTQRQAELGASLSPRGSTPCWLCGTGQASDHEDFDSCCSLAAARAFGEVSIPSMTVGGGCMRSRDVPRWPVHGPPSGRTTSRLGSRRGMEVTTPQDVPSKERSLLRYQTTNLQPRMSRAQPWGVHWCTNGHRPRGRWSCCLVPSESIKHFFNLGSSTSRRTFISNLGDTFRPQSASQTTRLGAKRCVQTRPLLGEGSIPPRSSCCSFNAS